MLAMTGLEPRVAGGEGAVLPPLVLAAHLPPVSRALPQPRTWVSAVIERLEDPVDAVLWQHLAPQRNAPADPGDRARGGLE